MAHTLNNIEIPQGCRWVDEFDWTPVQRSQAYSIGGALLIDTAVKLAGRPITLQALDDSGWHGMTRAIVQQLVTLSQTPEGQYPLVLHDGRSFNVAFRPGEDSPISARPLANRESPPDDWPYILTLRLIEI